MSVPAQSPVSSSTTLWATPSKEWVIPAKPKPGRKPKKDPPPSSSENPEVDAKGRRVQNRAAQRAFRERKQSQLAELQARVQQYEQGEIERNVALQNIAKRLKEENEKLRKENIALKEKLASVEEERDALRELSRKRWRDDSRVTDSSARKRPKIQSDIFGTIPQPVTTPMSYASSPSSIASFPDSPGHSSFSPIPSLPPPREVPVLAQGNSFSNIFDIINSSKTNLFESGGPLDTFDCGFCNENTPCVCRELALQQIGEKISPQMELKVEAGDFQPSVIQSSAVHVSPVSQPSILDNLPAYQPPVPIRRRNVANSTSAPIFPVFPLEEVASCTGDPSNCPACADDAFGKAFCAAISKSVASQASACTDCPSGGNGCCRGSSGAGCCGNASACGQIDATGPSSPLSTIEPVSQPPPSQTPLDNDTIPCDRAWRQIKSHPNVTFADLDLLAEVVARRSKCTGPRVEICPAPGSITPERGISPLTIQPQLPGDMEVNQPVLLTDPHARYHGTQGPRDGTPSLQLVPQDILIQCGRQRVREVQADGVRDALRLLDARFPLMK
ncbi:hypothetical protein EIP86_010247 [Pleurotus ostreatoroseus]|nr:hypothetical protein EIP86_010247 [Pleurotus ostreatoroseus]